MKRLIGKVALVTGGASGIGRSIARRLLEEGAIVAISDIQGEIGRQTAADEGYEFFVHDVCEEARWTQIVADIETRHGRLDILVNNAGISGPLDASNPRTARLVDWRRIFAVNVEGTFLGCRAVIPALAKAGGGSIINISSTAALIPTPEAAAYGASKAAVRHLTQTVAQYCAEQGLRIRCNSVHPGAVLTPMLEKIAADLATARGIETETVLQELREDTPLREFPLPEDVAAVVAYLASDESRSTTGAKFLVDGGFFDCPGYRPGKKT